MNTYDVCIEDEVLQSIRTINDVVLESEMNVMNSLMESYNKAYMILENYQGDDLEAFSIFQESSYIMEDGENNQTSQEGGTFRKVGNDGKKENILKSIFFFIPRLLGLIAKTITKYIKGEENENLVEKAKTVEEAIDEASEEEVEAIENEVNKDEGENQEKDIKVSLKDKIFTFGKKTFNNAKQHAQTAMSIANLIGVLRDQFDPMNDNETTKFCKEVRDILDKDSGKQFSGETIQMGIRAAAESVNVMSASLGALSNVAGEASVSLGKKLEKLEKSDMDNTKKQKMIDNLKKVSETVRDVSSMVNGRLRVVKKVTRVVNKVYGGLRSFRGKRQWAAENPRAEGESRAAYKARYQADLNAKKGEPTPSEAQRVGAIGGLGNKKGRKAWKDRKSWMKANPRQKNETKEQYAARYNKYMSDVDPDVDPSGSDPNTQKVPEQDYEILEPDGTPVE